MNHDARRRRLVALPALLVIAIAVGGIHFGAGSGAMWAEFKGGFAEALRS